MAKKYGENSTVDFAAGNLMSFGKSFSRLSGQPLDKSEIWYNDLEALRAYALTDAAFVGQKVVYIDTTASTVTHYSIELDGSLKEIGVKPLGDAASITVSEAGVVSLKNFGVEYYRLLTSDEEGYKEGEATYVLQTVDADHPWKSGLVPRVLDGAIAWYEPSNVTVEGLNDTVGSLQTSVDANEQAIGALETVVGDATSGLVKEVADNKAAFDAFAEEHTYTDDDIDAKVAGAFHFRGDAELEVGEDEAWTGNLVKDGAVIASPINGDVYQVGEVEYAYDGSKWVKLGFTLDLTGYATKIELNTAKEDLQGQVDDLVDADEALAEKDTELEGLIGGLRTDVDAINNETSGAVATAKAYTDDEISKLNVSQYATTEALGETNEAVAANTGLITEHKTLLDTVKATADAAATQTVVNAIDERLKTAEAGVSTNAGNITTNTNAISALQTSQATQDTAIEKNKTDLADLTKTVGTNTSDISGIKGQITSISEASSKNTSDLAALTTRVDTAEGTIAGHTTSIGDNATAIAGNKSLIDALTPRVTAVEGKVTTLESDNTTNKSAISALQGLVGVKAEGETAATGLHKAVDDLAAVVDTKANTNDVYSKTAADEAIAAAVAAVDHLKRKIVEALPEVASADANTIYMVKDADAKGDDKYKEYMVIDGAFACIGDTTVDLTNYVQKDDTTYTTALQDITNLKNVGSQANVLEAVKVNGIALEITDKAVNIGIATDTVLGVVLSSTADNKVSVGADGTMEVNKLNVNKLVQTEGEELILFGGTSAN